MFRSVRYSLHFEGNLTVIIQGRFSHATDRQPTDERVIELPVRSSDVMQLLEHHVSTARGDAAGTLTLVFDNGHTLRVIDDPHYESYRICIGQKEIIV